MPFMTTFEPLGLTSKPVAKHSDLPAQLTPASIAIYAERWVVETLDQADPFHPAAAGTIPFLKPAWRPDAPTATQSGELTQSTWRRKSPPEPDRDDSDVEVHDLPSQCSRSADLAKPALFVSEPTAQQSDEAGHA